MGLDMHVYFKENKNFWELFYWGKQRHIFMWFANKINPKTGIINECKYYKIDKSILTDLFDTCEKILKDHTLASKLLPVDYIIPDDEKYDEYYFYSLEMTLNFKNVLELAEKQEGELALYFDFSC